MLLSVCTLVLRRVSIRGDSHDASEHAAASVLWWEEGDALCFLSTPSEILLDLCGWSCGHRRRRNKHSSVRLTAGVCSMCSSSSDCYNHLHGESVIMAFTCRYHVFHSLFRCKNEQHNPNSLLLSAPTSPPTLTTIFLLPMSQFMFTSPDNGFNILCPSGNIELKLYFYASHGYLLCFLLV